MKADGVGAAVNLEGVGAGVTGIVGVVEGKAVNADGVGFGVIGIVGVEDGASVNADGVGSSVAGLLVVGAGVAFVGGELGLALGASVSPHPSTEKVIVEPLAEKS